MAGPTNVPQPPVCKPGGPVTASCCVHGEQKPRIVTIDGPTKLDYGGYDWKVRWELPAKTCSGGWVIQEIAKLFTYEQSMKDSGTKHFWEAWQIFAGNNTTRGSFDDTYRMAFASDPVSARIQITGLVRFYEIAKLPDDFVFGNPLTEAGTTYSTTKRPPFWSRDGATQHNLTRDWDSRAQRDDLWGEVDGQQYPGTRR